jgi:hypothetical protein
MSEGYHPEIGDTPICTEEYSLNYGSIIRCFIWIILLRISDIAYATSAMSCFKMSQREEHLKVTKGILAYLNTFPKGSIMVYTKSPIYYTYPIEDHPNWKDFFLMLKKKYLMIFQSQRHRRSG